MCEFDCRSIRVHVRATASFTHEVEGDVQHVVGYFQTTPGLINSSTDLDIDGIRSSLDSQIENFNAKRSGFTIDRILEFTIVITKYRPFHGRSYIPSPNGCKTSTVSSTSATRTKSVFYVRYFPASTSLRITRNAPITINLT